MSKEMVVRETGEVVQMHGHGKTEFSKEERNVLLESYCSGASAQEFRQLVAIAEARGLNPLLQQCYFVKRWNQDQQREVWAVQVSIDGMRGQAESTGQYDGQDEPVFTYDAAGKTESCTVRVYRKGCERPFSGTAWFSEYAATKKGGQLTHMWASKPRVMLSKCAESLALRKAFPLRLSGLYTSEEMEQSENGRHEPARQLAAVHAMPQLQAQEPQAEPSAPTASPSGTIRIHAGKYQGMAVADVPTEALRELRSQVDRAVGNPAKARYREANERLLAALDAELYARAEDAQAEADDNDMPSEVAAGAWEEGRE